MASSERMSQVWLQWMVAMIALTVITITGNVILSKFMGIYLLFPFGSALSEGSALTASWVQPVFNITIALFAIAATIYSASRPLEVVDYYGGL